MNRYMLRSEIVSKFSKQKTLAGRYGKKWDSDEIRLAEKLFAEGTPLNKIAEELKRPIGGVIGKLDKYLMLDEKSATCRFLTDAGIEALKKWSKDSESWYWFKRVIVSDCEVRLTSLNFSKAVKAVTVEELVIDLISTEAPSSVVLKIGNKAVRYVRKIDD